MLSNLQSLSHSKIILASASPRRSELLRSLGLLFEVIPSKFQEDLKKEYFSHPSEYVKETAKCKAEEVLERVMKDSKEVDLIISADTIVELNGVILEKPLDESHAAEMLQQLSGSEHRVYTGTTLILPGSNAKNTDSPLLVSFHEETKVIFGDLRESEILAYISSGEPMDKAGAYGIQGLGALFVKRIEGCYFNVMGLPLHRLGAEIDKLIQQGHLLNR